MAYYYSKVIKDGSFDNVIAKVTDDLKKEGFGVLSVIDVKNTLMEKINVDFKKYTILGACHPHAAHKILQKEDKAGVFFPCNVVVEENEDGSIEVFAVDPYASMKSIDNDQIGCHLLDIQQKLMKVIDNA